MSHPASPTPAPDSAEPAHHGVVPSILRTVAQVSSQRPWITMLWTLGLILASVALCVTGLRFKTKRADLIDPRADYQQRWLAYAKEFGDESDLVVVVEAESPELIKTVLDDLGGKMEREQKFFSHVFYKTDTSKLRAKGLQYQSPAELEAMLNRLGEFGPVLRGKWDLLNLKTLFHGLNGQLTRAEAAPQPDAATAPVLEMAEGLTTSLAAFARDPQAYQSPWTGLVTASDSPREEGPLVRYSLNQEGTMGILLARAKLRGGGFEGPTEAIAKVRELIAQAEEDHPQATFGLTGIPVLESDEMLSSQSSMFAASMISYIGVASLLFFGFRGVRHPLVALAMLDVGMVWSFGFTVLAVGHLNILSVAFVTILVGLGADFAIVFISQYLDERKRGHDLPTALVNTAGLIGPGVVTAGVAAAAAFYCAQFTDFLGVAELGLIAGGGILLCVVATFTVLPAMLAIIDRNVPAEKLPVPFEGNFLRFGIARHAGAIVVASLVLTVAIGSYGLQTWSDYDYNLLNLQAEGVKSVEVQKRIAEKSDTGLLFAVSIANSPEEARARKAQFEALPGVEQVTEVASYLPTHPAEETQLMIQGIGALLSHLPADTPRPPKSDPQQIGEAMEAFSVALADRPGVQAARIRASIEGFLTLLDHLPLEHQTGLLDGFQYAMTADLLARMRGLAAVANDEPASVADLPPGLAVRFVSTPQKGKEPRFLLQVHPRYDVWDIAPLTQFIKEIRSVDPEVTGTPLQNYEASRQIRSSYETVGLYALLGVGLILLIDFMSFRDCLTALAGSVAAVAVLAGVSHGLDSDLTMMQLMCAFVLLTLSCSTLLNPTGARNALLALMPPVVGMWVMMGILDLIGVRLNPANLIVLPLIIGIGVDTGVHVMHDFRHDRRRRYRLSASIQNAIILSSSTTVIGFGSMIISPHRGLNSFGIVLCIGVACCMFMSLILLPAILALISSPRSSSGQASGEQHRQAEEPVPVASGKPPLSVFYPDSAA